MSYEIYKFIHILGIAATTMGLGAAFVASRLGSAQSGQEKPAATRKLIAITHGVGLLLLLLGGFGMLARLGIHWPWPWWIVVKLLVWVSLGAWLTVSYRTGSKSLSGWLGGLALVAIAAAVVLLK